MRFCLPLQDRANGKEEKAMIDCYGKIQGHEDIKKELKFITEKFADPDIDRAVLPKGILLYGPKGNGKTLLIKAMQEAFAEQVDIAQVTFIYAGDFDEEKDEETLKALSDRFDSSKRGRSLIVGEATELESVPKSLLGEGKFEVRIEVDTPRSEDRKILFDYCLKRYGLEMEERELEFLSRRFEGIHSREIEPICRDAALHASRKKVFAEDIEEARERVSSHEIPKNLPPRRDYEDLVHEAGHILVCEKCRFYKVGKTRFTHYFGATEILDSDRSRWTAQKEIERMQIAMGGYLAEELIFGKRSKGCNDDIRKIFRCAETLILRQGYLGFEYADVGDWRMQFPMGRIQCDRSEKALRKFVIKVEKKTRYYLKSRKSDILALAAKLKQESEAEENERKSGN